MLAPKGYGVRLLHMAGLDLWFTPHAVIGSVFLAVVFSALGHYVFGHGWGNAIAGGIVLTVLHWFSEFWHNIGHNTMARRTGHPMTGTRMGFWFVLGDSLYPPDEPELPADVHIQRAWGGPMGSAVLTVIAGLLTLGGLAFPKAVWVPFVFFLDNLLVFTIGAFIPLGFNDISTILHWRKRRAAA